MAYFPNGTSGEMLDLQCSTCPVGADPSAPCPVLLAQYEYNYGQHKKGNEDLAAAMELLIDADGVCQMKRVMLAARPTHHSERAWQDHDPRECVADYETPDEGLAAINRKTSV